MPDPGSPGRLPADPPPSRPSAPGSAASRRRRPVGRLLALGRRIIRSDNLLVTVIAVAMILSALSVYQATEAADQADQLLDEARVVHSEAARDAGYLQTFIDHDAEVLRPYCEATLQRDIARVSYLDIDPDISSLVASSLMLDALEPLKLGDRLAGCTEEADGGPAYETARAVERLQHAQGGGNLAHADADAFEERAASLNVREGYLMSAALLFAGVVAAFFLIDQLGTRRGRPARLRSRDARRSQVASLAIGAVLAAVGLPLLILSTVRVDVTAIVFALLALFLLLQWFRARRRRRPSAAEAERRARAQWWAEVAGAITIVLFATAAVGLSLVSIHERDVGARADAERSFAEDLQRTAQQQSLRDLSGLSRMADLAAQEATARQQAAQLAENGGDPDALGQAHARSAAVAAMRAELDLRLQRTEQTLRDQAWESLHHEADRDCAVPPAEEAPLPGELYDTVGSDQAAVTWHVLRQQQAAHACDIVAAISRQEALLWSSHGSALTVALVVLGLAGFMFALAASTERSARSSRTLVGVGTAGTLIGVMLSLLPAPELLSGARTPDHDAAQRFGDDIAAASVHAPCSSHRLLSEAVEAFDGYGPAFEAKARAAACEAAVHTGPVLSSDVSGDALPGIIHDLGEAVELSSTPFAVGDLGWFQVLDGIHRSDAGQLRRGLDNTQQALVQLVESARPGPEHADAGSAEQLGPGVHYYRFNRALALAALGETDQALAHYEHATGCLDKKACEGGRVLDPAIRDDIVLAALADLELLGDAVDLDRYRFAILGLAPDAGDVPEPPEAKLTLFPQEVQVEGTSAEALPSAAVVWYHRAEEDTDWAVLLEPSRQTLHEGNHLDRPTPVRAVLPAGFYRADVYLGGVRLELTAEKEGDAGVLRHESQRLGVSVVVPEHWVQWPDDGVQWHVGPTESTGFTIRRVEGIVPDDLGPFLERKLREWPVSAGGDEDSRDPDGWFLGLDDPVVNWGADSVEMAGLAPYASHWGCGGALFLARVGGEIDLEQAQAVFDSILLDRAIDRLPPVAGPLQAGMLALEVPSSWDAAIRPDGGTGNLIRAKDCAGVANVLASEEPYAGGIEEYADFTIQDFLNRPEDFPGFDIEDHYWADIPGAAEAQVVQYTWDPEDQEKVRQWQVYAKRGGMVAYVTVTTLSSQFEEYRAEVDLILGSLELGEPGS